MDSSCDRWAKAQGLKLEVVDRNGDALLVGEEYPAKAERWDRERPSPLEEKDAASALLAPRAAGTDPCEGGE